MKCENAMFRSVSPLWRDGGKKLKYSADLCSRMLERYQAKLEITTKIVRAIRRHHFCNKGLWKGHMKREEYMVAGVKAQCKGRFGHTSRISRKTKAGILKGIAAYAVNALASNGNERYQNSRAILVKEPAFMQAQRLLR